MKRRQTSFSALPGRFRLDAHSRFREAPATHLLCTTPNRRPPALKGPESRVCSEPWRTGEEHEEDIHGTSLSSPSFAPGMAGAGRIMGEGLDKHPGTARRGIMAAHSAGALKLTVVNLAKAAALPA